MFSRPFILALSACGMLEPITCNLRRTIMLCTPFNAILPKALSALPVSSPGPGAKLADVVVYSEVAVTESRELDTRDAEDAKYDSR
jgi:hypothetical protein